MKVSIEMLDDDCIYEIQNKTSEAILKTIEDGKMLEVQYENKTTYINSNYIVSIQFKED